jgi:hypothetical protein
MRGNLSLGGQPSARMRKTPWTEEGQRGAEHGELARGGKTLNEFAISEDLGDDKDIVFG